MLLHVALLLRNNLARAHALPMTGTHEADEYEAARW